MQGPALCGCCLLRAPAVSPCSSRSGACSELTDGTILDPHSLGPSLGPSPGPFLSVSCNFLAGPVTVAWASPGETQCRGVSNQCPLVSGEWG